MNNTNTIPQDADLVTFHSTDSERTWHEGQLPTVKANDIQSVEDKGVENLWVKSYDLYQRLSVNPNHLTVDEARQDYMNRIRDDRTTFAQFGANTVEGAIVLGEYRK